LVGYIGQMGQSIRMGQKEEILKLLISFPLNNFGRIITDIAHPVT